MKIRVRLIRIGPREYETTDKRFHAKWYKRQGARSCYSVHDRQTGKVLRAFRVDELRETIHDMLRSQDT